MSPTVELAGGVLARVAPFFALVGGGWLLARVRLFDERMAAGLSAYVYWVAFPALLVDALAAMGRPDARLALGLVAYAACALGVGALVLALGRALGWPREARAGAAMAASVGNSAFMGLPIAGAVLGAEVARVAAAVVAVDFVLVAAVGVGLLGWAGGRSVGGAVLQALSNPAVLGAAAGVALALGGGRLHAALDATVALAGGSASPVALVALGLTLGLTDAREEGARRAPVLVAALAKLLLLPALTWAATGLAGAPPAFRAGATLLAATPTAVNVFIQTRTFDVFAGGAARIVALTTALACATLSAVAIALAASGG